MSNVEKTCEVNLELRGHGWLKIQIKAGEKVLNLMASDAAGGAGPVEMAMAVLAFFTLATPQSIYLELEGAGPNPIFRLDWYRQGYYGEPGAYVQIRVDGQLPGVQWESTKDLDTFEADYDAIVETDAFLEAMVGALITLIEKHGPEGINERWGGRDKSDARMTEHHLALLKGLLVRFEEEESSAE